MGRLRQLTGLAAPVLVGAVAAAVLLPRLGEPERIFFDETYYVNDARQFLELGGVENSFAVHPPLGKWLIAAGVQVFGDSPTGWRLPGVIAAVLTVVLVFLLAKRLLGSVVAATGAALLLTFDGLFIAQARIGMLDIFLVLFIVLAADLLLRDREARRSEANRAPPPWWRRGWLLGSGLALGLAIAVKWSGLFGVGAVGLVFLVTEFARRREALGPPSVAVEPLLARSLSAAAADDEGNDSGGPSRDDPAAASGPTATATVQLTPIGRAGSPSDDPLHGDPTADLAPHPDATEGVDGRPAPRGDRRPGVLGTATRTAGVALAALTLLPALVYVLSWVPWLANYEQTTEFPKHCEAADDVEPPRDPAAFAACDTSLGRRVTGLALHHEAVWTFHTTLESDHSYLAPATTWPILARPVVFYYQTCKGDQAAGVASTDDEGNVTEAEPCEVAEGNAAEIIALGNPALWWGFLLLAPFLLVRAAAGDPRAAIPLVLWAGQYVPWLVSPRPSFAFYMAPLVPFVAVASAAAVLLLHERLRGVARNRTETVWALACGLLVGGAAFLVGLYARNEEVGAAVGLVVGIVAVVVALRLDERLRSGGAAWWHNPGSIAGLSLGLLSVGLFVYFLPVWTAAELLEAAVRERWWFSSWV